MKLARIALLALVAALILPATGLCDTPKKPTSSTTDKDGKTKTTTTKSGAASPAKDTKAPAKTDSKSPSSK
jgi:hypothetical protein